MMHRLHDAYRRIGANVANVSSRTIVFIGWLGFMLYAYPGYMSYDSVLQLEEARSGVYTNWHPPAMAKLWGWVDLVIAGPLGMLLLQGTCFIVGAYYLLRRAMSPRSAAVCAGLLLWFPPVLTTMAVIWKDSQMMGYMLLGTALLLSPRLSVRVAGLVLLALSTAMRHNAFTMTFPVVVLLFVWSERHGGWKRYAISCFAWLTITASAQLANRALTKNDQHVWHGSLALVDIAGTLRHAPPMPDAELRPILAGTPLVPKDNIQQAAIAVYKPEWMFDVLWAPNHLFNAPTSAEERDAISRAWKSIVLEHKAAYFTYRAEVFREVLQITGRPVPSSIYIWFVDIQDPAGSAQRTGHASSSSNLQVRLQKWMLKLGSSWLFRPYLYLLVVLALSPLWLRSRQRLALAMMGITSEAALFFLASTPDYRYSLPLVISAFLVVCGTIAKRFNAAQTKQPQSHAFAS